MSFKTALGMINSKLILRVLLPKWAYKLPIKAFQEVKQAFDLCESKLKSMIEERTNNPGTNSTSRGHDSNHPAHHDVLSLLISAQGSEQKLTPEEALADAFIFYFAGHETSANTLVYALRLMALHPEVQEKASNIT